MVMHSSQIVREAQPKDALRIRQIITHSECSSFFDGDEPKKMFGQVNRIVQSMSRVLWLIWEGGVFLVCPIDKRACEAHVAVLPSFRGEQAITAGMIGVHRIFTYTACELVLGRTPIENRAAVVYSHSIGLRHISHTETHVISGLGYHDWLLSREDPLAALEMLEEHAADERCQHMEAKAKAARHYYHWITRSMPKEACHGG